MKLTIGTILSLLGASGNALTEAGILDSNGDFAANPSPAAIASAAEKIEEILKAHGLIVPSNVDKLIQIAPLLIGTL